MKQRRGCNDDIVFVQPEFFGGGNSRCASCLVADQDSLGKPGCAAGHRNRKPVTFIRRNIRHLVCMVADQVVDVGCTREFGGRIEQY